MKSSRVIFCIIGVLCLAISLSVFFIAANNMQHDDLSKPTSSTPVAQTIKTPEPDATLVPSITKPPITTPPTLDPHGDYRAQIVNFSSSGWFCPGGVAMVLFLNVSVQNVGADNITNLTLLIKRTGATNDANSVIQTLNVPSGQTVHASGQVGTDVQGYSKEFRGSAYTAIISFNGVVLDEKTIEITGSQF
jgi:hypothetical protein